MSIASEIERIQNAKTSIKTALENKGADVGTGTMDTYAEKINKLPVLTSELNAMNYLFADDKFADDIDVILKIVKQPTRADYAFSNATNLKEIDLSSVDMSKCTNISGMFNNCYNVMKIKFGNIESKEVTTATSVFSNCEELIDLDMSCFDFGKVTQLQSFSSYIYNLKNFKCFKNLGKAYKQKTKNYYAYSLYLSNGNSLTHESLMDIINKIYDLNLSYNVAGGGTLYTQQLTIGSTNVAKLTSAEIKKATDKGWTVS